MSTWFFMKIRPVTRYYQVNKLKDVTHIYRGKDSTPKDWHGGHSTGAPSYQHRC